MYEDLKAGWNDLIREVNKRDKQAAALLRSCKPQKVEGNLIYIQTQHYAAFERLQDPQRRRAVLDGLLARYGRAFELHISPSVSPPGEDVLRDPMVQAAQRLGGVVRGVSL